MTTKHNHQIVSHVCYNCRFWQQTGQKHSGIVSVDGKGEWLYPIGICNHEPVLGTSAGESGIASFISCWLWKKTV